MAIRQSAVCSYASRFHIDPSRNESYRDDMALALNDHFSLTIFYSSQRTIPATSSIGLDGMWLVSYTDSPSLASRQTDPDPQELDEPRGHRHDGPECEDDARPPALEAPEPLGVVVQTLRHLDQDFAVLSATLGAEVLEGAREAPDLGPQLAEFLLVDAPCAA